MVSSSIMANNNSTHSKVEDTGIDLIRPMVECLFTVDGKKLIELIKKELPMGALFILNDLKKIKIQE